MGYLKLTYTALMTALATMNNANCTPAEIKLATSEVTKVAVVTLLAAVTSPATAPDILAFYLAD
jgi:hypothetical protein